MAGVVKFSELARLLGDPVVNWDENAKNLNRLAENIIIEGISKNNFLWKCN